VCAAETETGAEPQLTEVEPQRRWFRLRVWKLLVLTLVFVLSALGLVIWFVGLPLSWTVDYDSKRFRQIESAIEADPQHLLGKPFAEVSRELGLESVPWDDVALQRPTGTCRMYHFRGFRLYMTVELLPAGITPASREQWNATTEELERHGTQWLAHDPPFVLIDGIPNQNERMERYRKDMEEMFQRINEEMKKNASRARSQ
jgi:hypothetical protein